MAADRVPPDRAFDELLAIYRQAERELRAAIARALASGRLASAGYRQRQLRHVLAVLAGLRRDGRAALQLGAARAYSAAAIAVDRVTGISGAFGGAHQTAVLVLADNAARSFDDATVLVGRRTDDVFRRAALRTTAVGVAAGDRRRDVSAALSATLQQEVADALTGYVDSLGRRWPLDAYTRMVARTTTREAVTAGTVARLTENGHDLVTVDDHDSRCEICGPFEGKTYSITGGTDGYDRLTSRPPFHPHCRHVLTPAQATFEAFERELGLAGPPPGISPGRGPRRGL